MCSGHAFKFLPVLGDVVLGVLSGDEAYEQHRARFAWRERKSERSLDACRSLTAID